MGMGMGMRIRHIVRIRQMLMRWRKKARSSVDIRPGHIALLVGARRRRYFVRVTDLNHPLFQRILLETEEKYGFSKDGPLTIPCDESLFEEILHVVTSPEIDRPVAPKTLDDLRIWCHQRMTTNMEVLGDSQPLLPKFPKKQAVC